MSGSFHATIHPRPANVAEGPTVSLDRGQYHTLAASTSDLAKTFTCTFEDVRDTFAELPRMFIEPDGSFVWVSPPDEPRWQLDGMLFDRDDRLLYVEIKGNCPAGSLDRLLAALGWPRMPVMFQLLREAVFLSEGEFRRYAGCAAS